MRARTRRQARPRTVLSRIGTVILILVYGIPLAWLVMTSLKSNVAIFADPAGIRFTPSFHSYAQMVQQGTLGQAMRNSAIIAVGTTLLTLVIAIPTAYGLDRTRGAILAGGLGVFVLLQMIPQTATIIPLYRVLGSWHLLGTLPGVILADTALFLPFTVLVLRPFVGGVPMPLEEAAALDGASRFTIFFRVVVPLMSNGIMTAAAIVFILSWGEFLYAISILLNPLTYPVSALIAEQVSAYGTSWSGLMALAAVGSLPVLVVFIMAQRRLATGLSLGAVK
jgi:multiple sugar transport system permease protein